MSDASSIAPDELPVSYEALMVILINNDKAIVSHTNLNKFAQINRDLSGYENIMLLFLLFMLFCIMGSAGIRSEVCDLGRENERFVKLMDSIKHKDHQIS